MIEVRRLISDGELPIDEINALLAQQSPGAAQRIIGREELRDVLRNPLFHMLIATDCGEDGLDQRVGMATIFFQRNIARWIAEIHDVVVDERFRGRHIGELLTRGLLDIALQFAREKDAKIKLFLTSRPSRVAANTLYQKLGFVLVAKSHGPWGTNLYKIIVEPSGLRGLP